MTKESLLDPKNFPASDCILLKNKDDFKWYQLSLDVQNKCSHYHRYAPKNYPCLVQSEFYDDPIGPYQYAHHFMYLLTLENKCGSCGHITCDYLWKEE